MGECLTKPRPTAISKLLFEIAEFPQGKPVVFSKHRLGFLQRRFELLCGDINARMKVHQFCGLLAHLPYSNTTLTRLYSMINDCREGIFYQELVEGMRILCYCSEKCLTSVLFYMYADHTFDEYVMTEKGLENILQDHQKRYKPQLSSISQADQRLEITSRNSSILVPIQIPLPSERSMDVQAFRSWTAVNVNLKAIQFSFLKDHITKLEHQLAEQYLKMDLFQKKLCLISMHWWENFKLYAGTKYGFNFERKDLFRRSSTFQNRPKVGFVKRKPSDDRLVMQSNQQEIVKCNFDRSFDCKSRIENSSLNGIFEGQLRKGLNSLNDYVLVTPKVYNKLFILYGGGPMYQRSSVKGYLQLYPYFVWEFFCQNGKIEDGSSKLRKYSKNDPFREISKYYRTNTIFYYRGVGLKWRRLPNDEEKFLYQFELQSVGFLANLSQKDEPMFLKNYNISEPNPKNPIYGDVFTCQDKNQTKDVCILRINKFEITLHNLTMNGPRTFTVSFMDFPKIVKTSKDSRVLNPGSTFRGLIDLGNSSYMNSCITVLFFQTFLQFYLSHISHIDMSNSSYKLIIQLKNETSTGQLGNPRKLKQHLTRVLKQYEDEHPHDAYNFMLDLISLIQKQEEKFINSPRILTELLDGKEIISSKCNQCGDFKKTSLPFKILSLPLKQDEFVEYRIHLWHNQKIFCFKINVDRNATLGSLKEKFENNTNLPINSYFLFEIADHDIIRNLGKLLQTRSLKQLNIKPSQIIYAYVRTTTQTSPNISKKFCNFLTPKGEKVLCQVLAMKNQNEVEIECKNDQGDGGQHIRIVSQQCIYHYPDPNLNQSVILLKILNRNNYDFSKICSPLVLNVPEWCSLQQIESLITSYFSTDSNNYKIRYLHYPTATCLNCRRPLKSHLITTAQSDAYCDQNNCRISPETPISWIYEDVSIVIDWLNMDACLESYQTNEVTASKIVNSTTLKQCLDSRLNSSTVLKDCSICHNIVQHQIISEIEYPKLLIVHLNRFKIVEGESIRVCTALNYPTHLDFSKCQYKLIGLLCSQGDYPNAHYISVIQHKNEWLNISDHIAKKENLSKINPEWIYMLIYIRQTQ